MSPDIKVFLIISVHKTVLSLYIFCSYNFCSKWTLQFYLRRQVLCFEENIQLVLGWNTYQSAWYEGQVELSWEKSLCGSHTEAHPRRKEGAARLQPPPNQNFKTRSLYTWWYIMFHVIYPSAGISHWNLLMTRTLEFWKIK